jgi:hypothetical protein
MAHHKVGLEETVEAAETLGKKPEHAAGLRRALKLIEYVRGVSTGDGQFTHTIPAVIATLDRLKLAIEAELENGGPLTTPAE